MVAERFVVKKNIRDAMKWIKLSERKPKDWDVILRRIEGKSLITNVWAFHHHIELENGSSISGESIHFDQVEWLEENTEDQQTNIDKAIIIERLIADLKKLTDEDRYEIICSFCKHCGSNDTNCYCHRDD